jgi:hypothetical protein
MLLVGSMRGPYPVGTTSIIASVVLILLLNLFRR